MKKKTALLVMTFCMVLGAWAQNLTLKDIYIRDPFILPMEEEGVYYMYATSSTTEDGVAYGGMVAYQSKDLKTWTGPVRVFDVPRDNFLTGVVWAPEVHPYNGKYYLFATLNSDIVWKAHKDEHPSYVHRATQIFWADRP